MGFRVHFDCADLARTTIGREPELLWEVLLGMHMLQTDVEPEVFGPWRRRTRARLTAIERELLVLAPPVGYSPDFLTPAESVDGLNAGLAAVARHRGGGCTLSSADWPNRSGCPAGPAASPPGIPPYWRRSVTD